jgi:hypothetical protein
MQGPAAYSDSALSVLPEIAKEHPDATAFTSIYRSMPSGPERRNSNPGTGRHPRACPRQGPLIYSQTQVAKAL